MNKVSKRFLFLTIAACVLLVAAVRTGLDWYVSSSGVREQLEGAAQRQLGVPVKIGAMHYSLWNGFRATDITASVGSGGVEPSAISLPSVSARVALWPLFSGQVVVKRLLFQEPSLVWAQNADGGWNLLPGKKPGLPVLETKKQAQHRPKPLKPAFDIRAVNIENARFRFVEKNGKQPVILEGVTVHASLEGTTKAAGTVAICSATLRNGLTVDAFNTPFTFDGSSLNLTRLDAKLAEGSVGGTAVVKEIRQGRPPFTLDLLFNEVDLGEILAQLGEKKANQRQAGKLQGNFDLYGTLGDEKSIAGFGHAQLGGGRMEQLPLVQLIGGILLMDVKDIEVRQAQLDLRVGEGKVFVDSLVMESPSLSLTAKGTSDFDGKLELAARLAVNSKLSRQLPGWVDANFQPVPGGNWRDVGFTVGGTLSHPDTDLLQVMVGKKLGNQFMNLLQAVSGKHKKKGDDKKKPEPEPTPTQEEGMSEPAPTP